MLLERFARQGSVPERDVSRLRERNMSLREKSVFVGNITYETTEDQLTLSWRRLALSSPSKLVQDRETGKHKGYGFCQYTDAATARCTQLEREEV